MGFFSPEKVFNENIGFFYFKGYDLIFSHILKKEQSVNYNLIQILIYIKYRKPIHIEHLVSFRLVTSKRGVEYFHE